MKESLSRLANLSQKESRLIIGLMSGTSLDGLDIALCKISGSGLNTKAEVLYFETADYDEEFKNDVRGIFSKKLVDLEKVTLLNAKIGIIHANLINQFLKKYSIPADEIDCIASHGQTIYHAPKRLHQLQNYPNATLQIGDADHIAVNTGILTLSDFRQKHIAAGGEGAPLALYGDYILFSSENENRVLLNMGGISNFTYLPKPQSLAKVMCTDCGPGNTLIDALCQKYFNIPFDKDGDIGRKGKVNTNLLNQMLSHPFFEESLPKTTGPELFNINFMEKAASEIGLSNIISHTDLISTATELTAEAICLSLKKAVADTEFTMYASGGGANNPYLMERIAARFQENEIKQMQVLGINGDAKEAVLFALLANETLCGSSLTIDTGRAVTMGKISLPG